MLPQNTPQIPRQKEMENKRVGKDTIRTQRESEGLSYIKEKKQTLRQQLNGCYQERDEQEIKGLIY